ncbi:MAG TPA: ABC transporter permease subunit [Candidatus Eisenbacteria bacterium]|nr:ABC transporter permease subunit [Candidatus Eisenbacteria bacterium]
MTGYHSLLEKEVVEAWRSYRLAVICGLFLALGIVAPLTTRYLPETITAFAPSGFEVTLPPLGVSDVVDQLLKNIVQFGALAAILTTMGAVASEKERGTAALVLTKPVTRLAFLLAKLAAIGLLFGLAIALAMAGAWLYTSYLFEPVPAWPWAQLAGVIWLSTMVYASITFLGSVLMRSSLGAAGVGFFGLIVLSLASIVPTLTTWLPAGLIPVGQAVALGTTRDPALDPARTIGISLAIIVTAVVLAWLRFRREEL